MGFAMWLVGSIVVLLWMIYNFMSEE